MSYPKSEFNTRPYRLWNANERKPFPWRYYSDHKRAHNGALIECKWAKVGVTVEVYNAFTGRLLGQYTRTANSITFMGGSNG